MSAEPLVEFSPPAWSDVEATPAAALSLQQLSVPYPIIVGVTGHRDIVPSGTPAVRSAVRRVLDELRRVFREALYVMTALADGADQLVAEAAAARSIPLIAVAPMPIAIYRVGIANRSGFDQHWDRAVLKLVLPIWSIRTRPTMPRSSTSSWVRYCRAEHTCCSRCGTGPPRRRAQWRRPLAAARHRSSICGGTANMISRVSAIVRCS